MIKIKNCKVIKCLTCSKQANVKQISRMMFSKKEKQVMVLDKKKPFGIITLTDIVYKVIAKNKSPSKTKAAEICTKKVFSLESSEGVSKAYMYMMASNHLFCPIVSNGKFIGLLPFSEALKKVSRR